MTVHDLKCDLEPFQAMWDRKKFHEVRSCADRHFEVGDELLLFEWDKVASARTGRLMRVRVNYITDAGAYGLPSDVLVMSVQEMARADPNEKRPRGSP